jgi:hypothetical protein
MGLHGSADPLATNQKAAGSSPAERATNYLQIAAFCPASTQWTQAPTTVRTTD